MSPDWILTDTGLVQAVVPGLVMALALSTVLSSLSMENGMLVIYHMK